MIRIALIVLLCTALPAGAQQVIAGLSQNRISISADFEGSEILIFGAIKRDAPALDLDALGVIVTVEGPSQRLTVRLKERKALIWVNDAATEIARAPSFYAVSTSGPLSQIVSITADLQHRITVPRAIRTAGAPMTGDYPLSYTDALIRIRERQNLYQTNIGAVTVREGTLFDTSIALPANLVEGRYRARIFLTQARRVVAEYETSIHVEKVGLERFLHRLAHERPLAYGVLSLVIAIAAGWGASAAFRYVRA